MASQISFKEQYDNASDVLIVLGKNPSIDVVSAGLGFYETLNNHKNVNIACPTPLTSMPGSLDADNRITSKIGNKNLVISLAVDSRDSIDKVSYNLDESGKEFHLIVQPRKGQKPLSAENVSYSYSGLQADLIFILGASSMQDLGDSYEAEKKSFESATTVSVDVQSKSYAQHDYSDSGKSSVSEVVYSLIQALGLSLESGGATDLMVGIDSVTNKLQSNSVKPDTFEIVAQLMRAGGVRQQDVATTPSAAPSVNSQAPSSASSSDGSNQSQQQDSSKVPDEWLSPKIYKSSNA